MLSTTASEFGYRRATRSNAEHTVKVLLTDMLFPSHTARPRAPVRGLPRIAYVLHAIRRRYARYPSRPGRIVLSSRNCLSPLARPPSASLNNASANLALM